MPEKQIEKIAFVFRSSRQIGRTLIHSLIEELRHRSIEVDDFNLYNESNLYDTGILDTLFEKKDSYDAVIVLDLGYLTDYRIHKSLYNCPVIMIAGDDPQNILPRKGVLKAIKQFVKNKVSNITQHNELVGNAICARQYDIVLTHQKECIEIYRKHGSENVFWFPYWYESTIHFKDDNITKISDVVTVMTPNQRRVWTMEMLSAQKDFSFTNGYGKYNRNCAIHYQTGKIVYNESSHGEFTMRIPEVLGNGVFLLTDELPKDSGLYDLFTPGKHFVIYNGHQDLLEKIRYYLAHPEEREKIAHDGFIAATSLHTERARVDQILDILSDFEKIKEIPEVSIQMITWDRPWLLDFTLSSLKNSLKHSPIKREIIILDQNSLPDTKEVIRKYSHFIDKVITMPTNVGMAKAWVKLYGISVGEYIIPIENDWWCDTKNDNWLRHALEVLKSNTQIAFIKLRAIKDRQYGLESLQHEPWSVSPFPKEIVDIQKTADGTNYYVADSKYNCFTFNPLLMRREFRDEFDQYYQDNALNKSPLRSGEDLPQAKWREQSKWRGASLTNGPFKHIGFPELKEHVRYSFSFIARHFLNILGI